MASEIRRGSTDEDTNAEIQASRHHWWQMEERYPTVPQVQRLLGGERVDHRVKLRFHEQPTSRSTDSGSL
jgi:type VI protein secretion system component VasK